MIFWFTGQPGSGKTTLGKALLEKLDDVFHIDGDDLRGLSANVDYSEQGRISNIRTAQSIAMYLDNKGKNVVVSVVAPYKWLREEFKERIMLTKFMFILVKFADVSISLQKTMRNLKKTF